MATELTVSHYCDICMAGDEPRKVAVEYTATLDTGNGMVMLELCETHAPPVRDALEVFARYAVAVVPEPRLPGFTNTTPGQHECPRCRQHYHNLASLRTHLRKVHGLSARDYIALGLAGGDPKQPAPCPHCDFVAVGKTGLSVHIRAHHPDE